MRADREPPNCPVFQDCNPSIGSHARPRSRQRILLSLGAQRMRVAILGNSSSGKSTLATKLSGGSSLPSLDLDTIYWEPGQVGIERKTSDREADLRRFCADHDHWVIEGCYADLVETSFPWRPRASFAAPRIRGLCSTLSRQTTRGSQVSHKGGAKSEIELLGARRRHDFLFSP